jgi:long-chain acyl-CoA synthetase
VTHRTGVRWVPAHGASELPVMACNPLDQPRLGSAGRAVAGVRLRVTSLESGAPVGPARSGEIEAQSDSLMAGYLPAEATEDVIVDGWYRTGDVGTLDADGWLRLTGRTKEMIKVRGLQVAPARRQSTIPPISGLHLGVLAVDVVDAVREIQKESDRRRSRLRA